MVSFTLLYFSPFSRRFYAYNIFSKNTYQATFNCRESARFVSIEEDHLVPLRTPMVHFDNSELKLKQKKEREGQRKRRGRRKERKEGPFVTRY